MAHASAIKAASGQLAALGRFSPSKEPSVMDVESKTLARIREWVADVSAESRCKTPTCAAIAGMLEAAVETLTEADPLSSCDRPVISRCQPKANVRTPLRSLPPTPFQASSHGRSQHLENAEMWS